MEIINISEKTDCAVSTGKKAWMSGSAAPSVLCLGNFDGVHIGHAALLTEAKKIKNNLRGAYPEILSGAFTFIVPPQDFMLDSPPPKITDLEEKAALIQSAGIDILYVADFTKIRNMIPNTFADEILIKKCGCVHAVCGYNFKYGSGGAGNPDTLKRKFGGHVSVIEPVKYMDAAVSSTAIRRAVTEGNMEITEAMLGRAFSLRATVVRGKMMGSKLGFVTANQYFPTGHLIPARGVYAALCEIGEIKYPAVSDVGTRPTFAGDIGGVRCETHVIGFSGDLYGQTIKVEFKKFLRSEMKFDTLGDLTDTIKNDIETTLEILRVSDSTAVIRHL